VASIHASVKPFRWIVDVKERSDVKPPAFVQAAPSADISWSEASNQSGNLEEGSNIKLAKSGDRFSRASSFMFLTLYLMIDQTPSFVTLGHPAKLRCSICERWCEIFSSKVSVMDVSLCPLGE